jgi:hypothetical protein
VTYERGRRNPGKEWRGWRWGGRVRACVVKLEVVVVKSVDAEEEAGVCVASRCASVDARAKGAQGFISCSEGQCGDHGGGSS